MIDFKIGDLVKPRPNFESRAVANCPVGFRFIYRNHNPVKTKNFIVVGEGSNGGILLSAYPHKDRRIYGSSWGKDKFLDNIGWSETCFEKTTAFEVAVAEAIEGKP